MGLDYILKIYCYSESHASCEANPQVNKTINARHGVGAWRVVLKWCLEHVKFATRTNQVRTVFSRNFFECLHPEISSFLLPRADITGLQIINSTTSHPPRLVFTVLFYLYLWLQPLILAVGWWLPRKRHETLGSNKCSSFNPVSSAYFYSALG